MHDSREYAHEKVDVDLFARVQNKVFRLGIAAAFSTAAS
jgi:hypothetical protein